MVGLTLLAALLVAILTVGISGQIIQRREWNGGTHRNCGGYWQGGGMDSGGSYLNVCSKCQKSEWFDWHCGDPFGIATGVESRKKG